MRCYHSAWHGPPNRRMCTVVYYKNPQGAVEEEATRTRRGAPQAELSTPKQYMHNLEDYKDSIGSLPISWLKNEGGSEMRARWIQRKGELGYLGEGWEEALARL